jgi:hypothetical protein
LIQSCDTKTGAMRIVPVLFFVLFLVGLIAAALFSAPAFAAPPDEKLPDLSKPQLHREKTKLEKAVDQAAAMLLQGKLPPTEDGVRFALWLYGEKRDVAYLDVATRMARELAGHGIPEGKIVRNGTPEGKTVLYWVAEAGGPTLEEARQLTIMNEQRVTTAPFGTALNLAKITAGDSSYLDLDYYRDPLSEGQSETDGFHDHFPTSQPLMVECVWLREHAELVQFSGYSSITKAMGIVAYNILDRFLDPKTQTFVEIWPSGDTPVFKHDQNATTALAVWETGEIVGDSRLRQAGQKALESDLQPALQDLKAAATAGLAAGRMSRHPVQIAIIGDPQDSTVTALRQTAYFLFEPRKIILNLDPKTDSKRMAELMYPPDAAPAMFVCVETLCSPPIKDPAELEKQVAEIKKLAAQVEQ